MGNATNSSIASMRDGVAVRSHIAWYADRNTRQRCNQQPTKSPKSAHLGS